MITVIPNPDNTGETMTDPNDKSYMYVDAFTSDCVRMGSSRDQLLDPSGFSASILLEIVGLNAMIHKYNLGKKKPVTQVIEQEEENNVHND
jgi:hypothetical protein